MTSQFCLGSALIIALAEEDDYDLVDHHSDPCLVLSTSFNALRYTVAHTQQTDSESGTDIVRSLSMYFCFSIYFEINAV